MSAFLHNGHVLDAYPGEWGAVEAAEDYDRREHDRISGIVKKEIRRSMPDYDAMKSAEKAAQINKELFNSMYETNIQLESEINELKRIVAEIKEKVDAL